MCGLVSLSRNPTLDVSNVFLDIFFQECVRRNFSGFSSFATSANLEVMSANLRKCRKTMHCKYGRHLAVVFGTFWYNDAHWTAVSPLYLHCYVFLVQVRESNQWYQCMEQHSEASPLRIPGGGRRILHSKKFCDAAVLTFRQEEGLIDFRRIDQKARQSHQGIGQVNPVKNLYGLIQAGPSSAFHCARS